MNVPLDEEYFVWLYSQIGSVKTTSRSKTYWNLAKILFTTEFVWLVPNDDNRIEDGRNLRFEFCEERGIEAEREWLRLPCSILELLIALSRRLSFEADEQAKWWFWHMMQNLGLEGLNDASGFRQRDVADILNDLIWRQYKPDGRGGLFPLNEPAEDQRRVEIWRQLNAYLMERY